MNLLIIFFISFISTLVLTYFFIPALKRLRLGQNIREDGPKEHLKKTGTPIMGGIVFIVVSLVLCFLLKIDSSFYPILFLTFGFFLVGFVDDYLKVVKKENEGFKVKQKFLAQIIISVVFLLMLRQEDTSTLIPFLNTYVSLGYLYYPFLLVVILGTVNGVNITDGLDGLSSSVTIGVLSFFLFYSQAINSNMSRMIVIFIGALVAFLYFNKYPARLFMGDTGSLALGGLVSGIAIYYKMPIIILLVGFIYFIEALSVIIQVSYYKKTKKRVFKMAPIHHHFELSGYKEITIVFMAFAITVILSAIAYFSIV